MANLSPNNHACPDQVWVAGEGRASVCRWARRWKGDPITWQVDGLTEKPATAGMRKPGHADAGEVVRKSCTKYAGDQGRATSSAAPLSRRKAVHQLKSKGEGGDGVMANMFPPPVRHTNQDCGGRGNRGTPRPLLGSKGGIEVHRAKHKRVTVRGAAPGRMVGEWL